MGVWNEDEFPLPRQRPLSPPSAPRLAILYALTGFPRLLLLAYIPIKALDYLHDARWVSVLFLWGSVGALAATLGLPKMVHRLSRRWAYVIVTATSITSFAVLAIGGAQATFVGLFLFVAAAAANEILLNLYALENLDRHHQSRYEPLRVTFSLVGFICAPTIGVALGTLISPRLPYGVAIVCALAAIAFFLKTSLKPASQKSSTLPSPARYLRRYFAQPRLRLAYVLSFGRAAWWQMFFVYSPILLIEMGYSTKLAGFVSSIALAMTVSVPFWVRIVPKIGVRNMVMFGFASSGLIMITASSISALPILALGLLVTCALLMSSLDSVGNVFFLRAVHSYERVEMAAVFSTYRDASQAIAPLVIGPLLGVFGMLTIFGIWGASLLCLAALARYLPRSL